MKERILQRHLLAARPIPIDQTAIQNVMDSFKEWALSHTEFIARDSKDTDYITLIQLKTPWGTPLAIWVAFIPSIGFGGAFGKDPKLGPVTKIFYDEKFSWKDLASHHRLRSILLHELTHALDYLSKKIQTNQPDKVTRLESLGISPEDYFNSPDEVRAYMQQIVDEVVAFSKDPKFQAFMLRKYPTNLKQAWIRQVLAMSETWKQIKPYLNSSNSNKILKAVYTVLDEAGYW
jgi:hypothetical protein